MTPEEYIKSKQTEHFDGRDSYYTIDVKYAERAVEMAREQERTPAAKPGVFGQQGWICPKCGRVYSPFTSMCSYCSNDNLFKKTCVNGHDLHPNP